MSHVYVDSSSGKATKRILNLPEYESSDESNPDTDNLTGALAHLSIGPYRMQPKRHKAKDDSNVAVYPALQTDGQPTDTLTLEKSIPPNKLKGADDEEATDGLKKATKELAKGSYGVIARHCTAKEVKIKANQEAGAGLAIGALAGKFTVEKEDVEVNAKGRNFAAFHLYL